MLDRRVSGLRRVSAAATLACAAAGGGDERLDLGRILDPRRGLDAGGDVDRPRMHRRDALGDVLGRQAARQDQRDLRAALRGQGPVPRAAGAAVGRAGRGVEQVEVGVVALDVADVGAGADPERLDHPRAGVLGHRHTERRPLVAVQLHVREPDALGEPHDLVERRVHEDAYRLHLAAQRAGDAGGDARVAAALGALPEVEPDRPGAQRRRVLGVLVPGDAADLHSGHTAQEPSPREPWPGARAGAP